MDPDYTRYIAGEIHTPAHLRHNALGEFPCIAVRNGHGASSGRVSAGLQATRFRPDSANMTQLGGLLGVRRYNGKRSMRSNAIWLLVAGFALAGSAASQERRVDPRLFTGPPSILKQCLDPGPASPFVGPSSRARECTRQYCAEPAYRAKVRAYAMSQPQSESEAEPASRDGNKIKSRRYRCQQRRLTIRPSRRRFTARLNSGVSPLNT